MSESLIKWITDNQHDLSKKIIAVAVRNEKIDESLSFFTSAIAEFETNRTVGTIILYLSGECEIYVFANDDRKDQIFLEYHEPKSEGELFHMLKSGFDRIALVDR